MHTNISEKCFLLFKRKQFITQKINDLNHFKTIQIFLRLTSNKTDLKKNDCQKIYLKISQRGYKLDLNRHLNSLSKNIKKNIMTKKRPRRERKRKK